MDQFSLANAADASTVANAKALLGTDCLTTDATTVATGDYIVIESESKSFTFFDKL